MLIPVFLLILTGGMAVAILKHRLYDIDLLINRTLVYGVLTAMLAGTYFGGVVLLQIAFRAVTGQGNAVAIVISTLAIAALFMPLRSRIQNIIDSTSTVASTMRHGLWPPSVFECAMRLTWRNSPAS